MIIDAHAHINAGHGPVEWREFLTQCRRNGVGLSLVSALGGFEPFPTPEAVRQYNAQARAFAGFAQGRVLWLAYLNPQHEGWREELDLCVREGAVGVKLWIALKDERGRLDNALGVVAHATDRGLPLLVHTLNRTDPNRPGEIHVGEFTEMAAAHPSARLVAAHAGGNWRQALGILSHGPVNVCVDVCGSFPERGMVEALARGLGAERVVFGSDMLGRSLPSQLAKVLLAHLSQKEQELILWKNAARLFDLPRPLPVEGEEPKLPAWLNAAEDHFCFCGRWPLFETPAGRPEELNGLLAQHHISRAYVGDLGAVFETGLRQANERFVRTCSPCSRIAPLVTVNPREVNWRAAVEGLGGFAGVLLHPYLHAWRLDDPAFAAMFSLLAERRLPVWINTAFGDHRFRHAGLASRPVAVEEVQAFVRSAPANDYVFQAMPAAHVGAAMSEAGRGRLRFDISRLVDRTGALESTVSQGYAANLVLGTEFPLRDLRAVAWVAARL